VEMSSEEVSAHQADLFFFFGCRSLLRFPSSFIVRVQAVLEATSLCRLGSHFLS